MKVFISWSDNASRTVALHLREWIPSVIQSVEPWMSAIDIDAGARWSRSVETQLSDTKFGIICLTKANTIAPWVLFETGALAKTIEETYVCPYLINLEPSEIPSGPLTQFQAKRATEKETLELLLTINKALGSGALSEEQLKKTFEKWWPDLKAVLDNLTPETTVANPARSSESKLDEILETVRDLSRRAKTDRAPLEPPSRARVLFGDDMREALKLRPTQEIAKEKIAEWEILTERVEFTLEIFFDPDRNEFVGHLDGFPAQLPVIEAGQSYPTFSGMSMEPKIVAMADQDRLEKHFYSIASELGGRITSIKRIR